MKNRVKKRLLYLFGRSDLMVDLLLANCLDLALAGCLHLVRAGCLGLALEDSLDLLGLVISVDWLDLLLME